MGERREYNPLPLFGNPILLLLNVRSRRIFPLMRCLPASTNCLNIDVETIVTRVKRYFCFMARKREKFRVAGSKLEYLRKPENSNFVETNSRTTESIEFVKEKN